MEEEGAQQIFSRSIEKHNVRYIGDGDMGTEFSFCKGYLCGFSDSEEVRMHRSCTEACSDMYSTTEKNAEGSWGVRTIDRSHNR